MFLRHDFPKFLDPDTDTLTDASRIKNTNLLRAAPASQATETADSLVRKYNRMVKSIARQVRPRYPCDIELDDLVQIGMLAMIEAAGYYENRGDLQVIAYLRLRVRGAMIDALRRQSPVTRAAGWFRRANEKAQAQLSNVLGRAPIDTELAAHFGMDISSYRTRVTQAIVPQFKPMEPEGDGQSPCVVDGEPDGFDRLAIDRRAADIRAAIERLPAREAKVIRHYFLDEMSLEEIGHLLGIGAARVCQIKSAALSIMRTQLNGWSPT